MTRIANQHRNNFWKYAKSYGKQIEVEDLYNKWSLTNHFSKNLDSQIRSLVFNDVDNVKIALTFSGTPEELKEYMENKGVSQSDPLLDTTSPIENTPLDTDLDSALGDTIGTPVSQNEEMPGISSTETETPEDQQVLPDMINS